MSSIKYKALLTLLLAIFWCTNASTAAPVCTQWNDFTKQTTNRLYSAKEVYGRLGIKFGYNHVYLIEKSGCYDLSTKNLSSLKFLFNNAVEDDASTESTFLGVASVKTYAYRMAEYNQPVVAAFFRNGNDLDASADWALPKEPIVNFPQQTRVVDSQITVHNRPYQPEVSKSVDSLGAVYSLINDSTDELVQNWHALLVAKNADGESDRRMVARNSYSTRNLWLLDVAKVNLIDDGVAIARNYLIKYRDSSSPSKKVFFTVENLGGARCLYVKLILPGREGPLLGVSEQSSELVVFKLDPSAAC